MTPSTAVTRVAIDATAIHLTSGGAGTYLRSLVCHLPGAGVHPLVLSRRNDPGPWQGAARVVRTAPGPRLLRLAWEQTRLVRAVRLAGPDIRVLHSPHYTMPHRVPSGLARVVTIHDLTMLSRPGDHQRAKRLLFSRAVRRAAAESDALICVSRTTAEVLTELVRVRVPIHVVPHGVDHHRFQPVDPGTDAERLQHLGIRQPYVLHLGTIEPRKRVDLLMRAHDRLHRPDVQLVLAGGIWPGMEQRLPRTRGPVLRLGFVDDAMVAALLRRAAVVAYPSAEEGFGLPIIEALACGAAVVTTAGGATAEAAGGGALLVDAALDDPALAEEALAAGLEAALDGGCPPPHVRTSAVAGRTWEASAQGHAEVYRSLC